MIRQGHIFIKAAPLLRRNFSAQKSKMHSIAASFKPDSSGTSPKQLDYIPSLKLNDGYEIPMLAYGLGTARSRGEAEDTKRLTVMAIKHGYYHLDGAQSYKNEAELGAAIKEAGVDRCKLFVTTKLQNMNMDVAASFAASLAALDLDYVDLYLIHAPFSASSPEHLQKTWAALEAIQASGRARSIGVSNFSVADLKTVLETARVKPVANQIEYHPYLQHESDGLLPFCRTQNIAVVAYGPLTAITRARPGPCDDVYAELARKYGVPETDVALRWCIDQGVVVVTTSASEERLQGYMTRVPAFKLTPKEIEDIAAEGRKKNFRAFWKNRYAVDDWR
ncbi:aldo/keto reductase [Nemania abortiva]|nr:aldo/keto reductase [Nemania abortiva]